MAQIMMETANEKEYKIGNNANIAHFLCLWKTRIQTFVFHLPDCSSSIADLLCFVKGVSFLSYGKDKPMVNIPKHTRYSSSQISVCNRY